MKKNIAIYSAFIIPVILTIIIHIYAFPKAKADFDQFKQYDDMVNFYNDGVFPTVGTKMWSADADYTPRMPGGFYYIVYTLLYKITNENFVLSRVVFMILCLFTLAIFLFWFYKRFGKYMASILSALILCNAYLFFASIDIYNPNIMIYLSFILFILFCEYVVDGKYSYISALFMFPLIALMGQCHFGVFFSIVPTLIVYHIVRFKKLTRKYIIPLLLSVFISFLLYLPYLISEINNGFSNTLSMISFREGGKFVGLPQIYCMLIYPTTEMSIFYGRTNAILYFWFKNNPFLLFGALMLLLTAVLSIYSFIYSTKKVLSKDYKINDNIDIMLKESMVLYLIYVPTTLFVFFIAKSKPGTFHYIYNVFALSFVPILIFIKNIEKGKLIKLKNILPIFAILVSVAFSLQIVRSVELYMKKYGYDNHKNLMEAIIKDANGNEFSLDSIRILSTIVELYDLASDMYGISDKWNMNENAKLTYFIYSRDMYFFDGKWEDVKEGKNKPIPQNAVKIWGDEVLAVYKYIKD
ncbi:hypothetical protein [uncultured Brachyspira sp.]|uniref:hypothetical protein n=1 Tax=uncultured Brachyspira sp. TaxID=221953 RepID=UPI00260CFD3B|nr:hypothetical protein [uncultured Brachyspira sp.]